ncbi:hypothetical protein CC80DRAFT_548123 [Byssothecium circinans]|uniref:Rhodopsin domain-containing protein n=1 Tax=Byssothecium circinans TaxID=147558 RepID=A0A6A5TVH6_9PLEO|nr:hypothetical protein CC80DRAFT_548123 [Byssothecium circinans]
MIPPTVEVTPEYLDEDIGPMIMATSIVMIILGTPFVGLRSWSRYLTRTPFGLDDILMPLAWLTTVSLCIIGIVMVKVAETGRHEAYVARTNPEGVSQHQIGVLINEFVQPGAVTFPKACVVILFLRVFTNKWERRAAQVLMALIIGSWIGYTVAAFFQCIPFAYNWDKFIPGGRCFDIGAFAGTSSVPNIVTDVAMMILPWRTVLHLKISTARRIGLFLIFLTGSLGIFASIVRTVVFYTSCAGSDVTSLYLQAACALSFKPLFRLVAHYLHIHNFISASRRTFTTTTTQSGKAKAQARNAIRLDTFESESTGRFTKLKDGEDDYGDGVGVDVREGRDEEEAVAMATRGLDEDEDVKKALRGRWR